MFLATFLIFSLPVQAQESGQDEKISGDIFEKGGGYIHPTLSVGGDYTDNAFLTENDEKSDYIWVISPEIWLALPGTRTRPMTLAVSPRTPAGFTMSQPNPEHFRRYQTYLYYGADILRYSDFSVLDAENHKLEGLFQYNLRNGLSVALLNQYTVSYDDVGVGAITQHDKYKSNLFSAILSYDVTARFQMRLDYANMGVDYDDSDLEERDRSDNAYSAYLFYKVQPKTSIFGQYRFIDIDYDINTLADNSQEQLYFGGVQWDMTAKSRGRLKAGYGVKDFEDPTIDEADTIIFEAELNHKFTPKTALNLTGFSRTDETRIQGTDYVLTQGLSAGYNQRFTEKLTGHLFLSYSWDDYQGEVTIEGDTKEREDGLIRLRPSLRFNFTGWLMAEVAYLYSRRDSNFDLFDFTENRLSLRIAASLYNDF
jgi:hypothetical protein